MPFNRRVIFDRNETQFEGRVTNAPTHETLVKNDKEFTYCTFQVVSNSNPFNRNCKTYFNCYCYGMKADNIYARITKGCSVFVIAEGKSKVIHYAKKLGIPPVQVMYFEVKFLYLLAMPAEIKENSKLPVVASTFIQDVKSIIIDDTSNTEIEIANTEYQLDLHQEDTPS